MKARFQSLVIEKHLKKNKMKIAGLQKFTLIDYPGKLACTIFLYGCNFRCGYCHNPELALPKKVDGVYSEEAILDFLKSKKGYIEGVCITGGETLLNPDLPPLLKKIKSMKYKIKLDTNGSNPDLLQEIINKKLVDYLAMDIKLDKDNYHLITKSKINFSNIEASIKHITHSQIDYEFRTTVIRGFHDTKIMKKIGIWLAKINKHKTKKYFIQNFIPRENKLLDKKFEKIEIFTDKELEDLKKSVSNHFEEVLIRN
jgi:pyruvate formate lyase activating enzyme